MIDMIKALFFDIDGTLVSFRTHEIPESTVNALEEVKNFDRTPTLNYHESGTDSTLN